MTSSDRRLMFDILFQLADQTDRRRRTDPKDKLLAFARSLTALHRLVTPYQSLAFGPMENTNRHRSEVGRHRAWTPHPPSQS
jgi:hypothetical protein